MNYEISEEILLWIDRLVHSSIYIFQLNPPLQFYNHISFILLKRKADTINFKEVSIKLTKTIILLLKGYNTWRKQTT
jgi:hypothetical protein